MNATESESLGMQTKPALRLRLALIACGAAFLPIAGWGWQTFSASHQHPGMLIAEPNDFVVQAESESDYRRDIIIQLKNDGGQPLRILGVETTCGCTQAAPLEVTELQRGTQVPLLLQLQLPTPGSEKSVVIRVRTAAADDPQTIIRMTMKGQPLDPPYIEEVRPESVRATATVPGTLAKAQVTVLSYEKSTEAAEEPWIVGFDATTIPDVDPGGPSGGRVPQAQDGCHSAFTGPQSSRSECASSPRFATQPIPAGPPCVVRLVTAVASAASTAGDRVPGILTHVSA